MTVERFVEALDRKNIDFFSGVPDSFLNEFCEYIRKNKDNSQHIIAANEGNAVAIASGHYIATGRLPLVYMQNSGIGNALNPIVSLADRNVYSIPMILLIGWRGEPGINDHVQHKLQGEITADLLKNMEIPYQIIDQNSREEEIVRWAFDTAMEKQQAVALIVRKGVFSGGKKKPVDDSYPMSREDAIEAILEYMPHDTIYVATTGRATRELYVLREERKESHKFDFLNVGSMGHASSIATGMALARPSRKIVCLDGDAAAIMHMGALAAIDKSAIPNLIHIVLNNGSHESVGGQPSAGQKIEFTGIAYNCGYETVEGCVCTKEEMILALNKLEKSEKACFIDVRIRSGLRDGLGPLQVSLKQNIKELEEELQKNNHIGR